MMLTFTASLLGSFRRFLMQFLQVVGDRKRPIPLTFLAHTLWPDGVGQVCPVVVTFFELLPGVFEFALPLFQAKERPKGGGGDLDAVVEVGFVGELGDAEQFVAEVDQF